MSKQLSPELKSVTVGLVTFNCAATIEPCLTSILNNDFPQSFELVLVDNGSRDSTLAKAKNVLENKNPKQIQFKIITRSQNNLSAARNDVVQSSNSDFIAFTDPDCEVASDWLLQLHYALSSEGAKTVGIGGANRPPPNHWLSPMFKFLGNTKIGHFFSSQISQTGYMKECDQISTCNAIFRKSAIHSVGGFSNLTENYGEDLDLCYKLRNQGGVLKFSAKTFVIHHLPNTLSLWFKKCFSYGRSQFPTLRRQGYKSSTMRLAPAFAISIVLISSVFKTMTIPYLIVGHWMVFVVLSGSGKISLQAATTQWVYLAGYFFGMLEAGRDIGLELLRRPTHLKQGIPQ